MVPYEDWPGNTGQNGLETRRINGKVVNWECRLVEQVYDDKTI